MPPYDQTYANANANSIKIHKPNSTAAELLQLQAAILELDCIDASWDVKLVKDTLYVVKEKPKKLDFFEWIRSGWRVNKKNDVNSL